MDKNISPLLAHAVAVKPAINLSTKLMHFYQGKGDAFTQQFLLGYSQSTGLPLMLHVDAGHLSPNDDVRTAIMHICVGMPVYQNGCPTDQYHFYYYAEDVNYNCTASRFQSIQPLVHEQQLHRPDFPLINSVGHEYDEVDWLKKCTQVPLFSPRNLETLLGFDMRHLEQEVAAIMHTIAAVEQKHA